MDIEIRDIKSRDYKKAGMFASVGMNFDWYFPKIFLKLFGRYFFTCELVRASQVIAAYKGDELVGVLLANMKGEPRHKSRFTSRLFVNIMELLLPLYGKGGADLYENTNEELFSEYERKFSHDGEIEFLASDPEMQGRGIGTMLLNELVKRERNKRVYLFTDSSCSYEFYDKKGFDRCCEKDILMELPDRKVPLKCFLYSRVL